MKRKGHDFNTSVGHQIKKIRKSLGIPLEELAQSVGVSIQVIHRYEGGQTAIPVHLFIFIAHVLGVSATELLPDSYNYSKFD